MPDDHTHKIPDDLTLGRQLCFAVHSAANTIDDLYRPLLAEHDLTYPQYIALMALAEEDDVSITHLASRLGVAKATMTPMLRRLEGKKLVHRRLARNNERQKSVTITDAGRALLSTSCRATELVFARTGLTQQQVDALIGLCKKVVSLD